MKIFCIGRNYIDYVKEIKSNMPDAPVVYMKPETSLLKNNQPFFYPDFTNNLNYGVEIVVKINRVGKNISAKFAHRYYSQIAIGINLIASDIQSRHIEKGLPLEIAYSFDNSAHISKFYNISEFGEISNTNFSLKQNNNIVQQGNTSNMIFDINNLIAYISKIFTVKIGDLIYTGTPSGVGAVSVGDKFEAYIENKKLLICDIK